jgi:RecB family endonuclease NucS
VGRIDLLAHHRREAKWLVVELKRNQTGDQTAGQVLRYIGWVKHHLAEPNEEVRGLIVAHSVEPTLTYAVSAVPNVDLYLYQVQFSLKAAPQPRR